MLCGKSVQDGEAMPLVSLIKRRISSEEILHGICIEHGKITYQSLTFYTYVGDSKNGVRSLFWKLTKLDR